MKSKDARTLAPAAQEDLRRRVVEAVLGQGMKQRAAAKLFGVSAVSVCHWLKAVRRQGARGLAAKRRGRPRVSQLTGPQAATVVRLIARRCPDQLHFPFALWTREAVRQLLARRCGLHVSVWTVGRYLRKWGFTPQKPVRRAYERKPKEVQRWLREEYPALARQAKRERAEILWGDQMGLRSDHQAGRSYGRRGHTPEVLGTGKRFGCNMISTVSNRGALSFMVFTRRFTWRVMLEFLRRLLRQRRRKVFLIVDGHPVHRSGKVARWVAAQEGRLRLHFLPGYSPELNPDEYLNQDVKSNALSRRRPHDQVEMVGGVRAYLRSTQRLPHIVRNYFQAEHVRYAAGG